MKLQLKRSNVLESGAAKQPTSEQMDYGELAVNYNQEDPAIFLKDSNNNIIRISGVGNISDTGQVELPASTVPPLDPQPGNLWFNSDEGRLYIYYKDVDSEQWVDASPDSYDPSVIPDMNDPNYQPGTLDDRYNSSQVGELPPDVNLRNEGALWWNSQQDEGKLYVLYNDPAPDGRKKWVEASPTPDVTGFLNSNDGGDQQEIIGGGGLKIDGDLEVGGSGTFAGNIFTNWDATTNPGYIIIPSQGRMIVKDSDDGVNRGGYTINRGGDSDANTSWKVIADGTMYGDKDKNASITNFKYKISGDGTASFASNVTVGGSGAGSSTNYGLLAFSSQPGDSAGDGSPRITYAAVYARNHWTTNNEGYVWKGASAADGNVITSSIKSDGSATFDGSIIQKDWSDNGTGGVRITSGSDSGAVQIKGNGNSTDIALSVRASGNSSSDDVVSIKADGSATFANENVSIGSQGDFRVKSRGQNYFALFNSNPNATSFVLYNTTSEDFTTSALASFIQRNDGNVYIGNNLQVGSGAADPTNTKIALKAADGSATFGPYNSNSDSTRGIHLAIGGDNANLTVQSTKTSSGSNSAIQILHGDSGDRTATINMDGSATFAGQVENGNDLAIGSGNKLYKNGGLYIRGDYADGSSIFKYFNGGYTDSDVLIDFKATGSATFSGALGVTGKSGSATAFYIWDAGNANTTTVGINADGSATFARSGTASTQINADSSANLIITEGAFISKQPVSDYPCFQAKLNNTTNCQIFADGSATFAGGIDVATRSTFANGVVVIANDGGVNVKNLSQSDGNFTLQTDGNAVFAGTVTANGTILSRASGDINVGDRLDATKTALEALKTAAQDSNTDLAGLKAAIVSALAGI